MTREIDCVVPHSLEKWPFKHQIIPTESSLSFFGRDSEELFNDNLQKMPEDWIYRSKKIIYNFNRHGLRMKKELDEIKDDYIFYSGTSFGIGIGIDEEDRYSELVQQKIGMDFINWSGPLYGFRIQVISFLNFLNTNYKLPRILVMEVPYCEAFTFYTKNNFLLYYDTKLARPDDYPDHLTAYSSLLNTDFYIQESKLYSNMLKGICKRLGIKYIELSFFKEDKYVQEFNVDVVDRFSNKNDINYCYARDIYLKERPTGIEHVAHAGIGIHKEASELIINQL